MVILSVELLKERGNDMIERLMTIFNRVQKERQMSLQWRENKKCSVQRSWIKRKNSRKPDRDIYNECNVLNIWNHNEDLQ